MNDKQKALRSTIADLEKEIRCVGELRGKLRDAAAWGRACTGFNKHTPSPRRRVEGCPVVPWCAGWFPVLNDCPLFPLPGIACSVLRLLSTEKDGAIAEKEKRIYELKKKNQVRHRRLI